VTALVIVIGVRVGTLRVGVKVAGVSGVIVALNVTTGAGAGDVGDCGAPLAHATSTVLTITAPQRAKHRKKINADFRGGINTVLLYHKPLGFAFFHLLRRI
jgi:hypothetical protein